MSYPIIENCPEDGGIEFMWLSRRRDRVLSFCVTPTGSIEVIWSDGPIGGTLDTPSAATLNEWLRWFAGTAQRPGIEPDANEAAP